MERNLKTDKFIDESKAFARLRYLRLPTPHSDSLRDFRGLGLTTKASQKMCYIRATMPSIESRQCQLARCNP